MSYCITSYTQRTMSASKGIALMWLRDQDAQELEKPVELSLQEKREEAKGFCQVLQGRDRRRQDTAQGDERMGRSPSQGESRGGGEEAEGGPAIFEEAYNARQATEWIMDAWSFGEQAVELFRQNQA